MWPNRFPSANKDPPLIFVTDRTHLEWSDDVAQLRTAFKFHRTQLGARQMPELVSKRNNS